MNDRAGLQLCTHTLRLVSLHPGVDSHRVIDQATLWLLGWRRHKWKTKQSPRPADRHPWQGLADLSVPQEAEIERMTVPSHVGLHGNALAPRRVGRRVRLPAVRIRDAQPTRNPGPDWKVEEPLQWDDLQQLCPRGGAGKLRPPMDEWHTGRGVQCMLFLTQMHADDRRREERTRHSGFLSV